MHRPWSNWPINDCGEQLIRIPPLIHCLKPHPYASLGAPYGEEEDPFYLREGVVERLLSAQSNLQLAFPTLRFAIFDAWRPVSVQAFMFEHAITQMCLERGIDRNERSDDPSSGQNDLSIIQSFVCRSFNLVMH